ncbi:aldehyde dehydrogenase family protein [Nocardia caishijiensis]|uniref:Aldehyde dehydrogenase n=1 Tax=Nocardia caishijiensis TaxID=184756 RepID=A0ABQ6YGX6_9NOCA|nr:aldehyde dehydrogenase family protein [Nocardia caishijiensis]KAF0844781.1 acyl-CoA reductase-like NAD-dependent aldehyde dehydrogenase [Nocardia caishijiensis]
MTSLDAPSVSFDVVSPATGAVVGSYPIHTAAEVDATVEAARGAGQWWSALGFAERARRLDAWRGEIVSGRVELAHLMHEEMGKPLSDAALEIAMAVEHLAWAARNARKVLGPRSVNPGLLAFNQECTLEYRPFGVVGVIGPWNYPVFTPLGSISFALAAGNAVVCKPSEYTPGVGHWLARRFDLVVPEQPVLQIVTGMGDTGAALCRSGVGKIGFTGSTATGRRVMAACAESLTPVLMELGGKDALIVDADADLDAAAAAAVWGGMSNAGQTCLGVERVYVHTEVYDAFVPKLVSRAENVHAGTGAAKIGPVTMPKQIAIIRHHIEDALARGARAVLGGADTIDGQFVQPTILVDVPEDAVAVTEETFGPTLTVTRVRDMDEAIERVNAGTYGLGGTVFSRRNGRRIADRIRSGATSINAYVAHATIAGLPLGGVGDSGFGRVHGPDGLKEFTYAKATTRQRFPSPLALTTFTRGPATDKIVDRLITVLHGRKVS